ncbi:MAG: pantoate--beta-alanine ligase [Chitinophagia bacterium]|nr:pantoate--beta-alanine ligase [Chitinophagia bacterium]
MIIFKEVVKLRNYLASVTKNHRSIGFVPTMGALHQGHLSLLDAAKRQCDVCVVSIFVNPTQFNDPSDYQNYPITVAEDLNLLTRQGCDILFLPTVKEMYPNGLDALPSFTFGYVETVLEGAHRPGHFKGVGMIVNRLLDIVEPHFLYLGQKDYQQCMVIKLLIEQRQNIQNPEVVICPTMREHSGLAMSSRNKRLSAEEQNNATVIYQCLLAIKDGQKEGDFEDIKQKVAQKLVTHNMHPEYITIANAHTLELLSNYNPAVDMVALMAVKAGAVRLIDNMLL